MAMLSQNIRNLKFMKNKKAEQEKPIEKTLSYFACKNIILSYADGNKNNNTNNSIRK